MSTSNASVDATATKIRTKPTTWHTKIDAPQSALDFYAALVKANADKAFETCHIFSGATNGKTPVIKFEGSPTPIAEILAGFLALPYGKKMCNTKGCCNPLHYLPSAAPSPDEERLVSQAVVVEEVRHPDQSDYNELVGYEIDKRALRNPNFEQLRAILPMADIDDARLIAAIAELTGEKK